MSASYSSLMQSKYFHPAFNSAIFDGPVRIYFAQLHESLALKIYFCLQQKYVDLLVAAKERHLKDGRNVLVMIYPTNEAFEFSFESADHFLAKEDYLDDLILGVNGPFDDDKLDSVLEATSNLLYSLNNEGARPQESIAQL